MNNKKLNIPRDETKFLLQFLKDKVALPSEEWSVVFNRKSNSFYIEKADKYGRKRITPSVQDFSSSTRIKISWLNQLMYDLEQVNGHESSFIPHDPKGMTGDSIVTASYAYGPFNSRFNIRDSDYPNRKRFLMNMNNGIPSYLFSLKLEYEEDLEYLLDFYNGYIEKVAMPFLETCQSLQKINDEIINWYPLGKITKHFPLHGTNLKLLIMGLCENPNYDAEYRAINKLLTPELLADDWGKSWQRVLVDIDRLVNSKEKEKYEEYL